jgi:hypothetical protein
MDERENWMCATTLFENLVSALAVLLKTVETVEKGAFHLGMKTTVFQILNQSWKLNAFSIETLLCVCQLVDAFVVGMRPALNVQLSFSQCVGWCALKCIPITTVCETEQISHNRINCPEFSGIAFQANRS